MNMKFATATVLGLLSLTALAPAASAADNGFYLGAGVTSTNFKAEIDGFKDDSDDNEVQDRKGHEPSLRRDRKRAAFADGSPAVYP